MNIIHAGVAAIGWEGTGHANLGAAEEYAKILVQMRKKEAY